MFVNEGVVGKNKINGCFVAAILLRVSLTSSTLELIGATIKTSKPELSALEISSF